MASSNFPRCSSRDGIAHHGRADRELLPVDGGLVFGGRNIILLAYIGDHAESLVSLRRVIFLGRIPLRVRDLRVGLWRIGDRGDRIVGVFGRLAELLFLIEIVLAGVRRVLAGEQQHGLVVLRIGFKSLFAKNDALLELVLARIVVGFQEQRQGFEFGIGESA